MPKNDEGLDFIKFLNNLQKLYAETVFKHYNLISPGL